MKMNREYLISLFHKLEQKHGNQPTKKQWKEDLDTPSEMPIRFNFGNWNNFVKACGREPLKPKFNKEARENSVKARKGEKGGNNKGGKRINNDGYVEIWMPDHPNSNKKGYVREHRLVMSNYLQRPLFTWEDVHHKNGIKTDNRLENLEILSRSEHSRLHEKIQTEKHKRKKSSVCIFTNCEELTASKYGLCTKHYRLQWDRRRKGLIEDITDIKEISRKHSRETKERLSEIAKKQPRQNGRFSRY